MSGIFGKAANAFEKDVRAYVARLLQACEIDYEAQIRYLIKGPGFDKLTLGQLRAVIEEVGRIGPARVALLTPGRWKLSGVLSTLEKLNATWVQMKHGEELSPGELLARLKSMLTFQQLVRAAPKA